MILSGFIMPKGYTIGSILELLKPDLPFDYLDEDSISIDDFKVTNNHDSFISISKASENAINNYEEEQKLIISETIGDTSIFWVQFRYFENLKSVLEKMCACKMLIDNELGKLLSPDQVLNSENYDDYIGGPYSFDDI